MELSWNFDWDCIESVDYFHHDGHFYHIFICVHMRNWSEVLFLCWVSCDVGIDVTLDS